MPGSRSGKKPRRKRGICGWTATTSVQSPRLSVDLTKTLLAGGCPQKRKIAEMRTPLSPANTSTSGSSPPPTTRAGNRCGLVAGQWCADLLGKVGCLLDNPLRLRHCTTRCAGDRCGLVAGQWRTDLRTQVRQFCLTWVLLCTLPICFRDSARHLFATLLLIHRDQAQSQHLSGRHSRSVIPRTIDNRPRCLRTSTTM